LNFCVVAEKTRRIDLFTIFYRPLVSIFKVSFIDSYLPMQKRRASALGLRNAGRVPDHLEPKLVQIGVRAIVFPSP